MLSNNLLLSEAINAAPVPLNLTSLTALAFKILYPFLFSKSIYAYSSVPKILTADLLSQETFSHSPKFSLLRTGSCKRHTSVAGGGVILRYAGYAPSVIKPSRLKLT